MKILATDFSDKYTQLGKVKFGRLYKLLGKGEFGKTYEINNNLVLKVLDLKDINQCMQEMIALDLQIKAAKFRLAPAIHEVSAMFTTNTHEWKATQQGRILRNSNPQSTPQIKLKGKTMQQIHQILEQNTNVSATMFEVMDRMDDINWSQLKFSEILHLVENSVNLGILHNDLHQGNLMRIKSSKTKDSLRLIDFGYTKQLDSIIELKPVLKNLVIMGQMSALVEKCNKNNVNIRQDETLFIVFQEKTLTSVQEFNVYFKCTPLEQIDSLSWFRHYIDTLNGITDICSYTKLLLLSALAQQKFLLGPFVKKIKGDECAGYIADLVYDTRKLEPLKADKYLKNFTERIFKKAKPNKQKRSVYITKSTKRISKEAQPNRQKRSAPKSSKLIEKRQLRSRSGK